MTAARNLPPAPYRLSTTAYLIQQESILFVDRLQKVGAAIGRACRGAALVSIELNARKDGRRDGKVRSKF